MARLRIVPGLLDITLYRGASVDVTLTLREELDSGEDGPLIPLLDWTGRLQVRSQPGSPVLLQLQTPDDGITLDGPAGTVRLQASAAQSGALPAGRHRYDLELTAPDGRVWPLVAGEFEVITEITA